MGGVKNPITSHFLSFFSCCLSNSPSLDIEIYTTFMLLNYNVFNTGEFQGEPKKLVFVINLSLILTNSLF